MEAQTQEEAAGQGPYYEQAVLDADVLPEGVLEGEARTKVPTLDDVMSPEELEQVTAEGLAANPEQTEEQTQEAFQRAQQMEAYQNYLKQQHFHQFMAMRPVPATLRVVDWGLVRYEMVIHEKLEFDGQPEIKELAEWQWYHGIVTGNIRVTQATTDEGTDLVTVSLLVPYDRHTTNLKYTPEQIRQQQMTQQARLSRKQRRQLH